MTKKEDDPALHDSATLAATLAVHGVRHLRTATLAEPLSIEPPTLIAALSKHKEPRVRESLIPLFLRRPTYAEHVPQLAATLPATASMTLRHMYTAAVYLQRLWRGTLGIYLGDFAMLPESPKGRRSALFRATRVCFTPSQ